MIRMQGQTEQLRDEIVRRFLKDDSRFVSGEELSQSLGISRTALWKQIRSLEEIGFEFEASRRVGYCLRHVPDELLEPLVSREMTEPTSLGHVIRWQQSMLSTNDAALELAKTELNHGMVVAAGVQKGGKGRYGRIWTSPRGGMWFSVIVQNPCAVSQAADLTLLASVAVYRALVERGIDCRIKWPNDILVNGKKLCGILAQMRTNAERVEFAVIGIGVNANFCIDDLPEEMRATATTIFDEIGHAVDRPKLMASILTQLEALYEELSNGSGGFRTVREEWKAASDTIGREVSIKVAGDGLNGVAMDVDDHGSLLLQTPNGDVKLVHSGEILFSTSERV